MNVGDAAGTGRAVFWSSFLVSRADLFMVRGAGFFPGPPVSFEVFVHDRVTFLGRYRL